MKALASNPILIKEDSKSARLHYTNGMQKDLSIWDTKMNLVPDLYLVVPVLSKTQYLYGIL